MSRRRGPRRGGRPILRYFGEVASVRALSTVLLSGILAPAGTHCDPGQPVAPAIPVAASVSSSVPLPSAVQPSEAVPSAGPGMRDSSVRLAREVRFAWQPPGASAAAYEMGEPRDQHWLVLTDGVVAGGSYPVLIAFHGQPKRGQNPSDYVFPITVIDVVNGMARRGEVPPLVVALPVFRFVAGNWPAFDLVEFVSKVKDLLRAEQVDASAFYVVGHSGAAGCGGDGMNRAHRIDPAGVGFFDTCLGPGWRDEVLALRRARVPTLVIHSVETAGTVPRQPREYSATFDFGQPYAAAGLSAAACPQQLPDAPLRPRPFQCTSDAEGITRGLIIDTGEGELAHEAVVPVALAYFLREYVASGRLKR